MCFNFIRYSLGPLPETFETVFSFHCNSIFICMRRNKFTHMHTFALSMHFSLLLSVYKIHSNFSNFTVFSLSLAFLEQNKNFPIINWNIRQFLAMSRKKNLGMNSSKQNINGKRKTIAQFSIEFGILNSFHSVLEPWSTLCMFVYVIVVQFGSYFVQNDL